MDVQAITYNESSIKCAVETEGESKKRILIEKKYGKVSGRMWHLNWPLKDNGGF